MLFIIERRFKDYDFRGPLCDLAMKQIHLSDKEAMRFNVMRFVEAQPNITQRELAEKLNVSLGRTNYCLQALASVGLIKIENFRKSKSKWRYAYILTPSGVAEKSALTGRFLAQKLAEFEALKAEIEAFHNDGAF